MAKKKILYVVEAMGSGIFTCIVELANELVDEYDIYIAYAVRGETPEDYKTYFDKKIHLIEVRNFVRKIDPLKDIKAAFEVKAIAKIIEPDIIHLHSSKAGVIGRTVFSGKKVPVFYTPHGYSFLMKNYSPNKRLVFKLIEKLYAKRKCTTISCSEGEHKETLKLTRRAAYVNNGINVSDLQDLYTSKPKDENVPFTVFTLGRVCYQKNPMLFNQIAEKLPDVHFVWIGGGELQDELKSENIEITGWIERKDALRISMQGSAFILTSLWEGLPISLLEAMFMKKPCIVNNAIGNKDVIHNYDNGFVCDTVEQFVAAIEQVRDNDCTELINKAYRDVLDNYNTNKMVEQYNQIYKNALK